MKKHSGKYVEHYEHGFTFGALTVTRLCCRPDDKGTIVQLSTPREIYTLYTTPTGKIRIYRNGHGELIVKGKKP